MALDFFPEVLAPVGDEERLDYALRFGADAVYLGAKEFSMRTAPENFTFPALAEGVKKAHAKGVRVYLTCNTLPRNQECDQLPEFIEHAAAAGVDALILSDIGALSLAKRVAPQLELHVSTQMGIVNYLSATELFHMGVKRVVLARELSLEEIREIRRRTPPELELEVFVHGAMCMSVSGRCLLSNYLLNRDANRGGCAQPCRWKYHLIEEKRPEEPMPILEDQEGSYILNAKDLCMIDYLEQLKEAGVSSFKIEGRAKSAYYVAVITNAYRCAADFFRAHPGQPLPEWIRREVTTVSHRQYSTGFYFGPPEQGQYDGGVGYIRQWDIAAVTERWENGRLFCRQRNRFFPGDVLEVVEPGVAPWNLLVEALWDQEGASIASTSHADMEFSLPCSQEVGKGAVLRKAKDGL